MAPLEIQIWRRFFFQVTCRVTWRELFIFGTANVHISLFQLEAINHLKFIFFFSYFLNRFLFTIFIVQLIFEFRWGNPMNRRLEINKRLLFNNCAGSNVINQNQNSRGNRKVASRMEQVSKEREEPKKPPAFISIFLKRHKDTKKKKHLSFYSFFPPSLSPPPPTDQKKRAPPLSFYGRRIALHAIHTIHEGSLSNESLSNCVFEYGAEKGMWYVV